MTNLGKTNGELRKFRTLIYLLFNRYFFNKGDVIS